MNGRTITTLKPPLHKGCGCGVAKGEKRLTDDEHKEIDQLLQLEKERKQQLIDHPEQALPNAENATIDDRKFVEYFFNPDNHKGWAKGVAFTLRLGYNADNWKLMYEEIREASKVYPARLRFVTKTAAGSFEEYEQEVILQGIQRKPANVILAWAEGVEKTDMHFVTAYIQEVDGQ